MNSAMLQKRTRLLPGMLLLATLPLVWHQVAVAALQILEEPVEMRSRDVPLWQLDIGRLGIRRCADCPLQWLQVDESTRYEIAQSGQVDREEFVMLARDSAGQAGMITLFLAPGTDKVLRLQLFPSRRQP